MGMLKRFSHYGFSRLLVTGGQFFLVPVAVSQLGASGFGVYNLMLQGAMLLRLFALQGVAQVLVRDYSRLEKSYGEANIYSAGLVLLVAGMLLVTFPVILFDSQIAHVLHVEVGNVWLAIAMAASFSFFGLKHIILYNKDFSSYTIWDTVQTLGVICFSVAVGSVFAEPGAYAVSYAIVTLLLAVLMLRKTYLSVFSVKTIQDIIINLRNYGFPLMIGEGMGWIVSVADRFQIAAILGAEQTGIYAAAYQLFVAPVAMLGLVVALVLQPTAFASEPRVYSLRMSQASTLLVFLSVVVFLLAILFGSAVFDVFFLHKAEVELPLIILLVLTGVTSSFFQLELIAGKYCRNAIGILFVQAFAAFVILFGNWFFLPRFGINAAAATSLAAYLVQIVALRILTSPLNRFDYFDIKAAMAMFLKVKIFTLQTIKKRWLQKT